MSSKELSFNPATISSAAAERTKAQHIVRVSQTDCTDPFSSPSPDRTQANLINVCSSNQLDRGTVDFVLQNMVFKYKLTIRYLWRTNTASFGVSQSNLVALEVLAGDLTVVGGEEAEDGPEVDG